MASLSDMTVTVELTDKAQTQLDFMLAEIQGIRAEIASGADTRRKLEWAEANLKSAEAAIVRLQAWKDAVPVVELRSIFDSDGTISTSVSDGLIPPAGALFQVHWPDGKSIFELLDSMSSIHDWLRALDNAA